MKHFYLSISNQILVIKWGKQWLYFEHVHINYKLKLNDTDGIQREWVAIAFSDIPAYHGGGHQK